MKNQALINEIVNDETQQKKGVDDVPAKPSALLHQKERVIEKILPTPTPDIIAEVFEEKVLPSLPSEVVAEVFQKKVLLKPSPEIVAEVFPATETFTDESVPRTKVDIVGCSDTDSETGESTGDESIDIIDTHPNVKFLPVEGLTERFIHLPKEFMGHGKHGHRNERVFLLDELLRQNGINRDEYKQLNTMLAENRSMKKWILNRIAKKKKKAK